MEIRLNSKKEVKENLIIYSIFILVAIIGLIYGNSIKGDFSFLRVWDLQNLLILFLGIPFLFLQTKAKLPNFFDSSISNKQRFAVPVLIGALFGILDILVFKVIQHPEPYSALPPFLQPFPYSLFLYASGAFEIEVFYRLIPLTLILLIGNLYAKGKFYNSFLWTGIMLTSLREPLEQVPGEGWILIIYSLLTGFLMNCLQAYFYKKSGFLASMTLRLGHYLFWHILLGIFVQYFELS
ncbi:hypothetical protein [Limnovirga soli]|uniref:CPBP family intramembrane metalloprotease n=1 Tax=Limnovirga soli TaxID=2656915 RepID=A0A8J8JWU0_9BACT|nr:hypothetical protein [Limnovirga soli]NNV55656.1 hypothetical protein [Limnovirga soli]